MTTRKYIPLLPQDIHTYSKQELLDLLVKNTEELFELIEKKEADIVIERKRLDVLFIQIAIGNKGDLVSQIK